jgi:hypothetical protein
MHSVILFPPSQLFNVDFVVVPKRLYSSRIYRGYHTLVTYPTTFLKEKIPSGYLFFLLYTDKDDHRTCHVNSIQCWNIEVEDVIEFVVSFAATTEIDRIIVETYSPPPERTHCVFPYSEVLPALPGNVDVSESLKMAHFKEVIKIPCYEFLISGSRKPRDLTPYGGTKRERQFYWEEWAKRPESLSIKAKKIHHSLFIENYLYDFPFFSQPDMVLFDEKGFVHWVPDVAPYLFRTPEVPYTRMDIGSIERAKIFRAAGEKLDTLIPKSMHYISNTYGTRRVQLDNIASPDVLESLKKESIVSQHHLLYERIILSKNL